jgi:hypothetical protein
MKIKMRDCDRRWGRGFDMFRDMGDRIRLALKDGKLPEDWFWPLYLSLKRVPRQGFGATMVYRIDI